MSTDTIEPTLIHLPESGTTLVAPPTTQLERQLNALTPNELLAALGLSGVES